MAQSESRDASASDVGSLSQRLVRAALCGAAIVWAFVLDGAYARAHPEIVRLPALLGSLFRFGASESRGSAWASNALAIGIALGVALSCYGFGRAAGRLIPDSGFPPFVREAAHFGLGCGIGAMIMFAAGRAGLFVPATAVFLLVIGWLLLGWSMRGISLRAAVEATRAVIVRTLADRWSWPSLACIALIGAVVLLTALAPPTARDALAYHLAVPKAYIASGRIVEIPYNVYSYVPFSTEMLFTWAMLLGSSTAPALVHALFGALAAGCVFAFADRLGMAPRWSALAAAAFVSVPSAAWNAGIAYNEMVRALAVTVAIAGICEWYASKRDGALIWCGIGIGLALSAKHTELVLLPVFALAFLLGLRRADPKHRRAIVRAGAIAAACAVVLPMPWYVQNVVWTGNPLYPYFWDLFPTHSAIWTADHAHVAEDYLRSTYGNVGLVGQLRLPWDVSVLAAEDVPRRFDGALGPVFLLVAPFVAVLAFVRRSTIETPWRVAAAFVAAVFVAWASQSQQLRFLIAVAPIAAVLAVVPLRSAALGRATAAALTAGVCGAIVIDLLVLSASVAQANPVAVAVGRESRDAYLSRRLGYYPFYQTLRERVPPVGRVFLICTRNDTFDLEVPSYSDSMMEDFTIGRIVNGARSSEEVYAALRERGFTHILVRHDILLNPRTTAFDDSAATERYLEFLQDHARLVRGDETYTLIEIK